MHVPYNSICASLCRCALNLAVWQSAPLDFRLDLCYRLPPEMIPTRGAEEDNFAELGTISPGCAFLKHLRSVKIKVVPGEHLPV